MQQCLHQYIQPVLMLYFIEVFLNLRSGFPLERGITRLDFNKLMCASRAPLKRDYMSNLNRLMYASRRRPIDNVVVLSIHGYVSIYRRPDEHFNVHTNRCEIPLTLAGQRSHWALDGVLKPLLIKDNA